MFEDETSYDRARVINLVLLAENKSFGPTWSEHFFVGTSVLVEYQGRAARADAGFFEAGDIYRKDVVVFVLEGSVTRGGRLCKRFSAC